MTYTRIRSSSRRVKRTIRKILGGVVHLKPIGKGYFTAIWNDRDEQYSGIVWLQRIRDEDGNTHVDVAYKKG